MYRISDSVFLLNKTFTTVLTHLVSDILERTRL